MESLKLLYHVAENWLSPVTVLDLENHFKKPVRLSYQSAFDSLYRYEKKIQLETGEINTEFKEMLKLDKEKLTPLVTTQEEYAPTSSDLAMT